VRRLHFSRRAEIDLDEIGSFIARDNPPRAVSFVQELTLQCRSLLDFPKSHPLRPDLGRDVRAAIHGKYLILYVVREEMVEILRVVHGARDLSGLGPL
jgi:toxin ParE1/3/4